MALTLVSTPALKYSARDCIDIVSVHDFPRLGLTHEQREDRAWLKNVVGGRFPNARILSFCYNIWSDTNVKSEAEALKSHWSEYISLGDALLWRLLAFRQENGQHRPIVFISRLLGGLLVKQCLLKSNSAPELRSIFQSTTGICFIGLVHNNRHPDFKLSILRCSAIDLGLDLRSKSNMEKLQSNLDLEAIADISCRFRLLDTKATVVTIREVRRTEYQLGQWFQPSKSTMLTSEELTAIGFDLEKTISVDSDYRGLSAFPPRNLPWFETLMAELNRMYSLCQARLELLAQTDEPTLQIPNDTPEERMSSDSDPLVVLTPSSSSQESSVPGSLQEAFSNTLNFFDKEIKPVMLPCHLLHSHYRNPHFVGRVAVIADMEDLLLPLSQRTDQRTFALLGAGGIGKTQVALNFVFKNSERFKSILWAHADRKDKLARDFADYAQKLGLIKEVGKDLEMPRELLKRWYSETTEPWLLVFDNADGPEAMQLLDEYWPQGTSGSVLVTSRNKRVNSMFTDDERTLEALDDESAAELLRRLLPKRLHGEKTDMLQVACRVECLPLGLRSAARMMSHEEETPIDFLRRAWSNYELISKSSPIPLQSRIGYPHSLATVWNMEYEEFDESAAGFMHILAFLDPDEIDEELFISGSGKAAVHFMDSPQKYTTCKGKVVRSSLVWRLDKTHLGLHRIVQEDCHRRMTPHQRQKAFDNVVRLLDAMLPVQEWHQRYLPTLWPKVRQYLKHVVSLVEHFRKGEYATLEVHNRFPHLLYHTAWYLYEQGTFHNALGLIDVAEEYCLSHLEGMDDVLADIYHLKGAFATEMNEPQAALANFRKYDGYVKSALERGLMKSPDVREHSALGSLGHGLQCLDRFEEAEPYYWQSLEAWKKLGLCDRAYVQELGLALCLMFQGKLEESEGVVQTILDERERRFGPSETSTYTCSALNIKGSIRMRQGRFDEAYPLHVHALQLFKRAWGEKHHRTADVAYTVVAHLHRRGDHKGAITLLEETMKIYRASVACDNEIARCLYKLGSIYQDCASYEKGRDYIVEAEQMRKAILLDVFTPASSEVDYEKLVRFWSR